MNIQLIEIGHMAQAIGDELAILDVLGRCRLTSSRLDLSAIHPEAEAWVLLSDHPCIGICETLADEAVRRDRLFVPVVLDYPHLTIGPVHKPGYEGCYHCFQQRLAQHNPVPAVSRAVQEYYATNIGQAPYGYHPSDVTFIAHWLTYHISKGFTDLLGKAVRMNMASRESASARIIGVHGCVRCGTRIPEEARSYRSLLTLIQALGSKRGELIG